MFKITYEFPMKYLISPEGELAPSVGHMPQQQRRHTLTDHGRKPLF